MKKDKKIEKTFGTNEWSGSTENCIIGCAHNCKFCGVSALNYRFKHLLPENWKVEKLRPNALKKKISHRDKRIMFPSSHDITPQFLNVAIVMIWKILSAGNDILIVSKPHIDCIREICMAFEMFKHKILFRFTLTSINSDVLKFWEPGAPDFNERLECLKLAYDLGFQTSVSCEPLLDKNPQPLVDTLLPYVTDSIWIGKMNYLKNRLKLNGYNDTETLQKADELLAWQNDNEIIWNIYNKYKDNPQIKWKESIKKVVGIPVNIKAGMDL